MAVKNTAKTEDNKIIADEATETASTAKKSFPVPQKNTNRETFFYNMVAIDVFRFRNVERDANMMALTAKLVEETGRDDGTFTSLYAERIVYTEAMYFDFPDDVPEEYKNLEIWWNMVKEGNDPSECYVWYVSNVPNILTNLFGDAVDDGHKVWKPAAQQTITLEKEAETDPN